MGQALAQKDFDLKSRKTVDGVFRRIYDVPDTNSTNRRLKFSEMKNKNGGVSIGRGPRDQNENCKPASHLAAL
jgi:hypothetical protein